LLIGDERGAALLAIPQLQDSLHAQGVDDKVQCPVRAQVAALRL
jgi:hypothetical protein